MSVDDDIARFNRGLGDLFNNKPVSKHSHQSIKIIEQKAPWLKKRVYRTAGGLYSMICTYDHHEGDRAWLMDKLQTIPLIKRESVMAQYSKMFIQAREVEAIENIKDRTARRAANTWLLNFLAILKC